MIAHDCKNTFGSGQRREHLGARLHVAALTETDIVAAEHDDIRAPGHQEMDGVRDVGLRSELAVMKVGDEADADTLMLRGKARHAQIGLDDPHRMPLVAVAIPGHARGGANHGRRRRLQERPARDRHAPILAERFA